MFNVGVRRARAFQPTDLRRATAAAVATPLRLLASGVSTSVLLRRSGQAPTEKPFRRPVGALLVATLATGCTVSCAMGRQPSVVHAAPTADDANGCDGGDEGKGESGVGAKLLQAEADKGPGRGGAHAHAAEPAMMQCALVHRYGMPDEVVTLGEQRRPCLTPGTKGKLLVRVEACGFTPGDIRTMRGQVRLVRHPPMPYVPGGDVAGVVVEGDGEGRFQPGDAVVSTWSFEGRGGLAEYALVDAELTVKRPASVSAVEAAALVNSSVHAWHTFRKADVKATDRVLVLGGSSGVGVALLQMCRHRAGAAYLATTCSAPSNALLERLGPGFVDRVIDYTRARWWEDPELADGPKFDLIIDCSVGAEAWQNCRGLLKTGREGGRFLSVCMDHPRDMRVTHPGHMFSLLCPPLGRVCWTSMRGGSTPSYSIGNGEWNHVQMEQVFDMAAEGKLRPLLANNGRPFPFSQDGVRAALMAQASWHPRGKVVVQVATDPLANDVPDGTAGPSSSAV